MFNVDVNVDLTPVTTRTPTKVVIREYSVNVSARHYQAIVDEANDPCAPGSTNETPPVAHFTDFTVAFCAAES
jgi:hypothetical protein